MSWHNQVLRVNLSRGQITKEPLNLNWANNYIGVRGLASKYLFEEMDPTAHALSPENVLIFATGPLTGTMASTSGRYAVVTKGALTNAIACSNSGGKFGAELKFAGYDLLILEGKSPDPVYLSIVDGDVELHSAASLWGKSVWYTETELKENDPQTKVASIGKSGENGVYYACIVNDLHRAAGRSGVGAVMGSKNLKAIAVRGTQGVISKNPSEFMSVVKETSELLADSEGRKSLTEFGTNAMIDSMQAFGGLPTHNFQAVQFSGTDKINPKAMVTKKENGHVNLLSNKACFGCTIACGRIAHVDKEHFSVADREEYWHASGGLEYETAFSLGSAVGVDDIDALTFAGYMMNEHGMDPISFGVTLAAAMELFERGIITTEDTDGVELNFGNAEALCTFAERTGKYEGFGQVLALGSKRMCEKYGHPEYSMTVKGQEFAGYDSRALQGMGLGYATSNRGACHLRHDVFSEDMEDQTGNGKAQPVKDTQDKTAMIDSTGLCLFTTAAWDTEQYRQLLNADLGKTWTTEDLLKSGERTWNLERLFNLKAGLASADDTLPKRLLEEPAPSGVAVGKVAELDKMLTEYYEVRNWNEKGEPVEELLDRLSI